MIKTLTLESIQTIAESASIELYATDAINEVNTKDEPKLSSKMLDDFFKTHAPKFNTMTAVQNALEALYKKNNVDFTPKSIKSVISNYSKHVVKNNESMDINIVSKTINEYRVSNDNATDNTNSTK